MSFIFLTNFGNVFSRSQCIINIRAAFDGVSNETKVQSGDAMLTIVDLAGAEREKRTGNQVILFTIHFCIYGVWTFLPVQYAKPQVFIFDCKMLTSTCS